MTRESTTSMVASDEKRRLAFRRLLLAKQLYLHGVIHSHQEGALNKMIAVHNFHNAIEIVLKAILLHYEIRPHKELNITFDVMLNTIDGYLDFKKNDLKLPYRQQLVVLNQQRNQVQHHAVEPESSMMEEWRVFTRRFLRQVYQIYFRLPFDSLSPLDMIENATLRELLRESLLSIEQNNLDKSLILSKVAFEWAVSALLKFLPEQQVSEPFFQTARLHQFGSSKEIFEELLNMSRGAVYFTALLWSGISPIDYKRLRSCTDSAQIHFSESGRPEVIWLDAVPDKKSICWTHDFVVNTIVHWQSLGFTPSISAWASEASKNIVGMF